MLFPVDHTYIMERSHDIDSLSTTTKVPVLFSCPLEDHHNVLSPSLSRTDVTQPPGTCRRCFNTLLFSLSPNPLELYLPSFSYFVLKSLPHCLLSRCHYIQSHVPDLMTWPPSRDLGSYMLRASLHRLQKGINHPYCGKSRHTAPTQMHLYIKTQTTRKLERLLFPKNTLQMSKNSPFPHYCIYRHPEQTHRHIHLASSHPIRDQTNAGPDTCKAARPQKQFPTRCSNI